MPTKREREYYRMGFHDGQRSAQQRPRVGYDPEIIEYGPQGGRMTHTEITKPKKKLSDWQKFIKANSSKKKFKFANGKLKLKSMGIAYRKTAVYKRNKKK